MRLYRLLLRLYPRRFRLEYSDDMVALLQQQLGEDHGLRIVGRTALDLVVSVPTRHMEAHMSSSSAAPLIILFVAAAAAFAVIGGPVGLAVALVLLATAGLLWRRSRPIAPTSQSLWWKLLASGVALLVAFAVTTSLIGELPDNGWFVGMASLLVASALIASGVVLGIAGRIRSA